MKLFVVIGALFAATLVKGELNPAIQFFEEMDSGSRIIGGELAVQNQFPHSAQLRIGVFGGTRNCGGSLISARHILSAAHCFVSANSIQARLGSLDMNNPALSVTTSKYLIHPQYNPNNLNNDIALADFERDIQLTDSIKPIALPRLSQMSQTFENTVATVSGWGYTSNTGPLSQFLRFVNLTVVSNQRCTADYNSAIVIDSTICCVGILNPQQSSCSGDSGGALIAFDATENNYIQVGIVSFGSSLGCDSGRASGYVRPHHYWQFISNFTGIPIKE